MALIFTNPILVAIRIQSREPSIQRLLQVIQVLRVTIALPLSRARIALGKPIVIVKPISSREPSIVAPNSNDGIVARSIQLLAEIVGPSIHIVLDGIGTVSVGVVGAVYLHEPGGWTTSVGIARGLLHSDEGENGGIDPMTVSCFLEIGVVLCAVNPGVGVEFWAVDVVETAEVKKWWVPAAVVSEARIEPVFGSVSLNLVRRSLC